ncbi:MAG: hypothetical protein HYV09_25185 [Deltaproteobacteria bacterium]|nr:hypothetical protein [Deltaproteobacteria bacterium]
MRVLVVTAVLLASGAPMAMACSASPDLASRPDASRSEFAPPPCAVAAPATSLGPASFQSIYVDLLGPTSVARCVDATCHGGSTGQAGLALGASKDDCYAGLKAYGLVAPSSPTDAGGTDAAADAGEAGASDETPESVLALVSIVSSIGGAPPPMPRALCGNRALRDDEIARIKAWGARGAQND